MRKMERFQASKQWLQSALQILDSRQNMVAIAELIIWFSVNILLKYSSSICAYICGNVYMCNRK